MEVCRYTLLTRVSAQLQVRVQQDRLFHWFIARLASLQKRVEVNWRMLPCMSNVCCFPASPTTREATEEMAPAGATLTFQHLVTIAGGFAAIKLQDSHLDQTEHLLEGGLAETHASSTRSSLWRLLATESHQHTLVRVSSEARVTVLVRLPCVFFGGDRLRCCTVGPRAHEVRFCPGGLRAHVRCHFRRQVFFCQFTRDPFHRKSVVCCGVHFESTQCPASRTSTDTPHRQTPLGLTRTCFVVHKHVLHRRVVSAPFVHIRTPSRLQTHVGFHLPRNTQAEHIFLQKCNARRQPHMTGCFGD